jgi:hypothetical protein
MKSILIAASFVVTASVVNAATVYKCTTPQGKTIYSDTPCDSKFSNINILPNELENVPPRKPLKPTEGQIMPGGRETVMRPLPPVQAPIMPTSPPVPTISPLPLIPMPLGTQAHPSNPMSPDWKAWRDCIPHSIGPGGCDSISPGGGLSIGPGGGLSIGRGGGLSIGTEGGQSIGPGGGQSIGPGGGQSIDRDRTRGLNPDTLRPYQSGW